MITNRLQDMTKLTGQSQMSRGPGRWSGVALGCAALAASLVAGSAGATETYSLRYAPGAGGGDMSAPLDPGWYGQIAGFAYHADHVNGAPIGTLSLPTASPLGTVQGTYSTDNKIDIQGLLPRITYISTQKLLDANIGFTAVIPLIHQKVSTTAALTPAGAATFNTANLLSGGAIPNSATVNAGLAATAGDDQHDGSKFALGDVEVAPIMRWSHDAHQVVFIPAILLGTGEFKAGRVYNPGAGKFNTFRPTLQYSYIGEGWDFGARAAFSISGRNRDTKYRSGNTWNLDWSVMKFITDSTRIGLQGYAIYQVADDTVKSAAEGGISVYNNVNLVTGAHDPLVAGRGKAMAIGPAVSWIKDSGTLLLEGKVLKEFAVENRPEGTAAWLTLSKPL